MKNERRRAVVTGATRGIGYAIAECLLQDGLEVIATGTRKDANYPAGASYHQVDFLDDNSVNEFVEYLKRQKIDVLINNVGSFEIGELADTKLEQVERMLDINFKAAFSITQEFLPQFKNQQSGLIVNIGSIITEVPRKDIAAYTISKFALQGYTKMLCDELKDFGVKVCEIIPGSINTSSWDGIEAPKDDFVQPSDIVSTVEMVLNSSKGANFEQIIVRPTNRIF